MLADAYGTWSTGPAGWSGSAGRPGRKVRYPSRCPVCCSSLFPLFRGKRPQMMYLGMSCGDLASKPKYPRRAPTHSIEVKEYVNNGTHWLLPPGEILQLPEGSHSFPSLLYLVSRSLFRSCSVILQLSHRSRCFLYHVYLSLLMGRDESSALLCHCHLGPPFLLLTYATCLA